MGHSNRIDQRIRDYGDAKRLMAAGLYQFFRPIESEQDTQVVVNGRMLLMFGSNSYLGLTNHPKVKEAAARALAKYGTACAGSRFLNGTLDIHIECEEKLASFVGKEAALLYSTGFQVNQGVISALVGRGDYVLLDKLNHASIVDGARLSYGRTLRFRHNDMDSLEEILRPIPHDRGKLIVADGVFSMDGDIIDLPAVVALCRKYNAWLMVDEAHSLGVLGAQGRGIEEHFALGDVVDIKMGTLSKTIPSVGGYVAGPKDMIDYLRHASRAYIFSAALPPAQAAAALEAFRVILDEPERIGRLRENTDLFLGGLREAGFDTLASETAIVPVICGTDQRAFEMTRACQMEDTFVLPVVSPAVPEGSARLRATVTAAHEKADIKKAMDVIIRAGRTLGVLS